MAKFIVRYVVVCEFLLGSLCLVGVLYSIRKLLLGGPMERFFVQEGLSFSLLALWCLATAVGVLKFAKWAWFSTILLGLFVIAASGLAVLLARSANFRAEPGSQGIAVYVFLSTSVGLVMWLLPATRRYI
jgi:hypothetical protein